MECGELVRKGGELVWKGSELQYVLGLWLYHRILCRITSSYTIKYVIIFTSLLSITKLNFMLTSKLFSSSEISNE